MFCAECGEELAAGANFCGSCGARVGLPAPPAVVTCGLPDETSCSRASAADIRRSAGRAACNEVTPSIQVRTVPAKCDPLEPETQTEASLPLQARKSCGNICKFTRLAGLVMIVVGILSVLSLFLLLSPLCSLLGLWVSPS